MPLKLDDSNDKRQSGKRELKKPHKHYFACITLEKNGLKATFDFAFDTLESTKPIFLKISYALYEFFKIYCV